MTGRGVLICLGLFFGSIFVANGALIYTALSTFHGEELENSYDASQEYNQRIADARAQEQLGWVANVTTRQEGRGERVVADFRDRDGEPISGLDVSARFVHPFDRGRRSPSDPEFRRRRLTKASPLRYIPAGGTSSSRRRRTAERSSGARTRSRSRRPPSGIRPVAEAQGSVGLRPPSRRRVAAMDWWSRASIAAPASHDRKGLGGEGRARRARQSGEQARHRRVGRGKLKPARSSTS